MYQEYGSDSKLWLNKNGIIKKRSCLDCSLRTHRKTNATKFQSWDDFFKLLLLSNQWTWTWWYCMNNGKEWGVANPHIWGATTWGCVAILFDKWLQRLINSSKLLSIPCLSTNYLIHHLIPLSTNWIRWTLIVSTLVECPLPYSSFPPFLLLLFISFANAVGRNQGQLPLSLSSLARKPLSDPKDECTQ